MAKKKRRRINPQIKATPVNPFCTGAGGAQFETFVASYYVLSLLNGEFARGLENTGSLREIALQQRNLGHAVDDIIVRSTSASLSLQVKHKLSFTNNDDFKSVLKACWKDFNSKGFRFRRDSIGIALSQKVMTAKSSTELPQLTEWARNSTSSNHFFKKVDPFKEKKILLNLFSVMLRRAVGRKATKTKIWQFFSSFAILHFDFDKPGGRDSTVCLNLLKSSLPQNLRRFYLPFYHSLLSFITETAIAGGEIDMQRLLSQPVFSGIGFATRNNQHIPALLVTQAQRKIEREVNSRRYIPEIFVEIEDTKDIARVFSYSSLFLKRVIDRAKVANAEVLNKLLQKVGLSERIVRLPSELQHGTPNGSKVNKWINGVCERLNELRQENKKVLLSSIPQSKRYLFGEISYKINSIAYFQNRLFTQLQAESGSAQARCFLLVSKAGSGKTNFVCDFVSRFLLPNNLPVLYFTGRDLVAPKVDDIFESIFRSIYACPNTISVDEILQGIGRLCNKRKAPLTIIIDGINEHPELNIFTNQLEQLIEKLLSFDFIKVILTCRSEYFNERFANLAKASFSGQKVDIKELQSSMSDKHKKRMVFRYLDFFNISYTIMTMRVLKQFGDDPLLLRFFCEAYGNPSSQKRFNIGELLTINKYALFQKYYREKIANISLQRNKQNGTTLGMKTELDLALNAVVEVMLTTKSFSSLQLSRIDAGYYGALRNLVEEGVVLRSELVRDDNSQARSTEGVSFTFDEFRDFLIADIIVTKLEKNPPEIMQLIRDLLQPSCIVAEGVRNYLFHIYMETRKPLLRSIVRESDWFEDVFLNCVFETQDSFITKEDIDYLKATFTNKPFSQKGIFYSLLYRWDTKAYPNLNINVLVDAIDGVGRESITKVAEAIFRDHFDILYREYNADKETSLIKTVNHIKSIILHNNKWNSDFDNLIKVLVRLSTIRDNGYYTRDAIDEIHKKYPSNIDEVIEKSNQQ